jgi:tRNA G18 (ribose-2'-O)-methylase SpoU
MRLIRIEQLQDPRLDDYRNVPDAELIRRRRLFVGEGRLVVRRLLAGGHRVVSLLLNEPSFSSLEPELAALPDSIPVYVGSTAELADIVGFNLHRGCLALAERPADRGVLEVAAEARLLLALDGVTDADNVGSAFRNAAAFGVSGVLLRACCDPLYRKAVRTSMGAVLQVPYARADDWVRHLTTLKASGFTLVALTPRMDAEDISAFAGMKPHPEKLLLLVGSETAGLSAETIATADRCVRIPMRGGIDSLNLATATGIALYVLSS